MIKKSSGDFQLPLETVENQCRRYDISVRMTVTERTPWYGLVSRKLESVMEGESKGKLGKSREMMFSLI